MFVYLLPHSSRAYPSGLTAAQTWRVVSISNNRSPCCMHPSAKYKKRHVNQVGSFEYCFGRTHAGDFLIHAYTTRVVQYTYDFPSVCIRTLLAQLGYFIDYALHMALSLCTCTEHHRNRLYTYYILCRARATGLESGDDGHCYSGRRFLRTRSRLFVYCV